MPEIYNSIYVRYSGKSLAIDIRERLASILKSAQFIIIARNKVRYAGGTAREHASRPRLEPYVDIGLLKRKPVKI